MSESIGSKTRIDREIDKGNLVNQNNPSTSEKVHANHSHLHLIEQ